MHVVIAGGGRTGSQLAKILLAENHTVGLIESRKEVVSRIHRELPTEVIHEGSVVDTHVLEKAGIRHATVLAAVTSVDEQNLGVCFVARSLYQVPRTIARVNNPRCAWLFDEKFAVDVAVNQADITARLIEEEMVMGDLVTLLKLRRGNFSLVDEKVMAGTQVLGVSIKDLGLPDQCVIAAIIRQGKVIVPRGSMPFEEGDEILAITDAEGAKELSRILTPR